MTLEKTNADNEAEYCQPSMESSVSLWLLSILALYLFCPRTPCGICPSSEPPDQPRQSPWLIQSNDACKPMSKKSEPHPISIALTGQVVKGASSPIQNPDIRPLSQT